MNKKILFSKISKVTPEDESLKLQIATPLKVESRRDMRALAFHFVYAVDRLGYSVPLEKIITNFKDGFNLQFPDSILCLLMRCSSSGFIIIIFQIYDILQSRFVHSPVLSSIHIGQRNVLLFRLQDH